MWNRLVYNCTIKYEAEIGSAEVWCEGENCAIYQAPYGGSTDHQMAKLIFFMCSQICLLEENIAASKISGYCQNLPN